MGLYDFAKEFSVSHPYWTGFIILFSIAAPLAVTLASAILTFLKK